MIVSLAEGANVSRVRRELTARGLWVDATERDGRGRVFLVVAKGSSPVEPRDLEGIEGVGGVTVAESPHPRIDAMGGVVRVGDIPIGGKTPVVIAGPCSVESAEAATRIAGTLARHGVRFLRGGAYKPRTSPYAFQGKGAEALGWLHDAAAKNGMHVVTEVLSEHDVDAVAEHAALMQIGSRNMHNYALLKATGRTGKPVLLKRAMSATVEEWLLAGEYLLMHGASGVVFCERGVRSFDTVTRNLLDLGSVALLAHVHRLPVVVDPSHATGRRELVLPLARAALAAGAAGVMIECHDDPACAESDGAQALAPEAVGTFAETIVGARKQEG